MKNCKKKMKLIIVLRKYRKHLKKTKVTLEKIWEIEEEFELR